MSRSFSASLSFLKSSTAPVEKYEITTQARIVLRGSSLRSSQRMPSRSRLNLAPSAPAVAADQTFLRFARLILIILAHPHRKSDWDSGNRCDRSDILRREDSRIVRNHIEGI